MTTEAAETTIPDFLVIGAVRYAVGRMTCVVGETVDWLLTHWDALPAHVRDVIRRDLEREFARDDELRASRIEANVLALPLGMDMDRRQWERLRGLWKPPQPGVCRLNEADSADPR